jgi:hypothetical protein
MTVERPLPPGLDPSFTPPGLDPSFTPPGLTPCFRPQEHSPSIFWPPVFRPSSIMTPGSAKTSSLTTSTSFTSTINIPPLTLLILLMRMAQLQVL